MLAQIVPLCQVHDARACSYMFNCQIDALNQPPLPLIPLFDLAADFPEGLFHFHGEVMKVSCLVMQKEESDYLMV
ncbi:MAG TPA: hypothetical protein VFY96_12800 [Candidatus Binatia bacterium]|nr:hypothetical protein [Candidatus Binatia bacterium]